MSKRKDGGDNGDSNIFDMLTDREKLVLKEKFGIDELNSKSFAKVGQQFDITRERIREIEQKALRKLNRQNDPKNDGPDAA